MTRCSACDQPLRGTPFCPSCGQPTRALGTGSRPVRPATPKPTTIDEPQSGEDTLVEGPEAVATPPVGPPPLPPQPTAARRSATPAAAVSMPPSEAPRKGGGGGSWIVVTGMVALLFVLLGCCLMTGVSNEDPAPSSHATPLEEIPARVEDLPDPERRRSPKPPK